MALVLLSLIPAGCKVADREPPKSDQVMIRMEPGRWPDLADDLEQGSLFRTLEQSRAYLRRLPPERTFKYGPDVYPAAHLLASLETFERLYKNIGPGPALKQTLVTDFILYRSTGREGTGEVICTGYYEPQLNGSLIPDERYRWPIYSRPDDLIEANLGLFSPELTGKKIRGRLEGLRLLPYFSRREIDRQGALAGRGLELAWVDDPVDLFFLHIQGSGRIRLPDGQVIRVGYAASNGRPYRSLGKHLNELRILTLDEMSMQAIKDWLSAHPEQTAALLDHNESYIFFRLLEGDPVGNINVPLTPGRSVALDHRIFPKGALAWLQTRVPEVISGRIDHWRASSRFVLVQDTGGAIRGPGRLDLFFGHGREAELSAGHMKEPGTLFFLILKKP